MTHEEPTFPVVTAWHLRVAALLPRTTCPVCVAQAEAFAWRCADYLPDSQQSRRDSMADAETLQRYVYGQAPNSFLHCDIHDAAEEGIRSVVAEDEEPAWAYVYARTAASAAFRAVPGLRA